MFSTALQKKRAVGLLLLALILALFLAFNRIPKLDAVGTDLDAVTAPQVQCFQGFCIEREPGSTFLSRWWVFSLTYLRLVAVGMTFAFLVAGLAEAFIFPSGSGRGLSSGGAFKRTLKGLAVGPVMNLCSACIVPVSTAFGRRGAGIEGAIAMVQASATMNIPALAMVFFIFTPMLGISRLIMAVVGALAIGPIVVMAMRRGTQDSAGQQETAESDEGQEFTPWRPVLVEGFQDWMKTSLGYLVRMGPIMVVAGFTSGLAIQWITPETVSTYLGNDIQGVAIAATFGILINVPLLFEIPLVALLLLLGMGTAPAATLLFAAAAGGPMTFWGLARLMPRRAIATFATATWLVGVIGGLSVLAVGALVWEAGPALRVEAASAPAPPRGSTGQATDDGGTVGDTAADPRHAPSEAPDTGVSRRSPIFEDVTVTAGVDFLHHEHPEEILAFGAGVAVFDFDNDGFYDIYVSDSVGPNGLYRNNGDGTFVDVAAAAGVDDPLGRGNGSCAADYDNDGDRDLYVTNYGPSRLFRNNGDGTFSDATAAAALDDSDVPHRSMGCAWGDYDQDGLLDLVVVRHLVEFPGMMETMDFFQAVDHLALLRNIGDGSFADVTPLLGDTSPYHGEKGWTFANVWGAGFQPGWVDFDNDGDPDLSVVNDFGFWVHPNVLWRNDGPAEDGSWIFSDVSIEAGTNLPMYGMAMAVGDYNLDGSLDLFMTNMWDNVLLRNNGDGVAFTNVTNTAGVGAGMIGDKPRVSWGAVFFDYDNDRYEDLYVVSGFLAVDWPDNPEEQPNVLMRNRGNGTFADVSAGSGADDPGIGRGGVYGDFNGDGCLDLFVANHGQRARLFQNVCDSGNNWLVVRTAGTQSNRDGIGARITLDTAGVRQIREISSGGSQMGQNMLAAHFGLGTATLVDSLTIRWPSGRVQTLTDVTVNQRLTVAEPE